MRSACPRRTRPAARRRRSGARAPGGRRGRPGRSGRARGGRSSPASVLRVGLEALEQHGAQAPGRIAGQGGRRQRRRGCRRGRRPGSSGGSRSSCRRPLRGRRRCCPAAGSRGSRRRSAWGSGTGRRCPRGPRSRPPARSARPPASRSAPRPARRWSRRRRRGRPCCSGRRAGTPRSSPSPRLHGEGEHAGRVAEAFDGVERLPLVLDEEQPVGVLRRVPVGPDPRAGLGIAAVLGEHRGRDREGQRRDSPGASVACRWPRRSSRRGTRSSQTMS